jgi:hypothetical protein
MFFPVRAVDFFFGGIFRGSFVMNSLYKS